MIEPITGLVWYLNVLVFFYLIATVIPQFSIRNLTLVYMGLYMIVGAGRVFGDLPCTNLIMSFCYVAKFCGIPLLGTAVYFLKEQRWLDRIVVFLWFFVLTLGLLRFESYLNGTVHCYTNAKTFYFAFALVFIAWILGKYAKGSERVKRFLKKADQILLPFYLVHFSVGFNVIYWLRKFDVNVYICVFAAYLAALCCAKAVAVAVKSASRLIAYARRSRHSGGHAKV